MKSYVLRLAEHFWGPRPGASDSGSDSHAADLPKVDPDIEAIAQFVEHNISSRNVATFMRTATAVYVAPQEEGFVISVTKVEHEKLFLTMGGWSDDVYSRQDICRLIDMAVQGKVRVRNTLLNGRPWKHSVDIRDTFGDWHELGGMSYLRFDWIRRDICECVEKYADADI